MVEDTNRSKEIAEEALEIAKRIEKYVGSDRHSLDPARLRLPSKFKPGAKTNEIIITSSGIEVMVNGKKRTISFDS